MKECGELDHHWLAELAPHFYEDTKTKIIKEKYKKEVVEKQRQEEDSRIGLFKKKVKTEESQLSLFQSKPKKTPNIRSMLSFDEDELM